jgi:hypothetical protein
MLGDVLAAEPTVLDAIAEQGAGRDADTQPDALAIAIAVDPALAVPAAVASRRDLQRIAVACRRSPLVAASGQ